MNFLGIDTAEVNMGVAAVSYDGDPLFGANLKLPQLPFMAKSISTYFAIRRIVATYTPKAIALEYPMVRGSFNLTLGYVHASSILGAIIAENTELENVYYVSNGKIRSYHGKATKEYKGKNNKKGSFEAFEEVFGETCDDDNIVEAYLFANLARILYRTYVDRTMEPTKELEKIACSKDKSKPTGILDRPGDFILGNQHLNNLIEHSSELVANFINEVEDGKRKGT